MADRAWSRPYFSAKAASFCSLTVLSRRFHDSVLLWLVSFSKILSIALRETAAPPLPVPLPLPPPPRPPAIMPDLGECRSIWERHRRSTIAFEAAGVAEVAVVAGLGLLTEDVVTENRLFIQIGFMLIMILH